MVLNFIDTCWPWAEEVATAAACLGALLIIIAFSLRLDRKARTISDDYHDSQN